MKKLSRYIDRWRSFIQMGARFVPYVRKQSRRLFLALIAGFGYTIIGMLEPWPLKLIFDNVFLQHPLPSFIPPLDKLLLLKILIACIILIALIRGVFYYYQQLLTSRSGQQIVSALRVDLYSHIQQLSFSFHDRRRTGDLLARLTTDIRILREILISMPLTISNELLLMIGMITVMAIMDWQLTLIALMVVPILALLLKKYQKPMKNAIRKQREREGHLTTIASEVLGAIKVVQGFHQEKSEVDRFRSKNKNSLRSGLKATRLEAKFKWASDLAVAIVTAIVIGVASQRVLTGVLTPGDLLVFTYYLRTFNRPLRRIARLTERMARGTASGERILNLFNIKPKIQDLPKAIRAPRFKGRICYDNIKFHYQKDSTVLSGINFTINPGEHTAIVGPTGSGKSTIANLLPRFYDPSSGRILIDNEDIRNCTLGSLREQISVVFQEPILFATSIAENIAYGKPNADINEIKHAAEKAYIHKIIEALPKDYETVIGERGCTLSGGQRQCITIARAIIKNSPIVILDEPTSGLDMPSAKLVMSALRELMVHKTVILISHQKEIVNDVDRVIKLERGSLVS